MTDEEAKTLADKILNCGHNNSLTCWKSCRNRKNNFDHNDVVKLAKLVKEMSECPYIKDGFCDIVKCDEFHIRADEQAKCETCIHKVTKADIDAIEVNARADEREKALDEFANWYRSKGYSAYDIGLLVREYKKDQNYGNLL